MGAELPSLSEEEFGRRLTEISPEPPEPPALRRLHRHYEELRRWNRSLSLVGRGEGERILERHYVESLAALPLLGHRRRLVDLGSGAGFPGFILAAARPALEVTLVEARQRKWAFLLAAARHAGLSLDCLNARVGPVLPARFPDRVEIVTSRAVKLTPELVALLRPRLAPDALLLAWTGGKGLGDLPGVELAGEVPLSGESRRIRILRPVPAGDLE